MKLSQFDNTKHAWSILSRGFSGCGKTIASCGKEFRPIFVFDIDQRMSSIYHYYMNLDGHCNDIDYETYTMGSNFSELDKKMDVLSNHCPYKTVAVASLTAYIHLVLVHLLNHKSGGSRTSEQKSIAGIKVNEIEDYNAEDAALIFELIGFLMALKRKGINVILEAHLTNIEYRDLKGNTTNKIDTLTKGKKAPAAIPGYFDESWVFTKDTKLIVDEKTRTARNESRYIMNPTGTSLIDGKTSRGVKEIDWTGKDFTVELMKQISGGK